MVSSRAREGAGATYHVKSSDFPYRKEWLHELHSSRVPGHRLERGCGHSSRGLSPQGANNRVRIGVIGTGGRARGLMTQLKTIAGRRDDGGLRRLRAAPPAGRRASSAPNALKVSDYRRILDNREIDAVLIGAPDHWHKTMTLDAVAAGKDVYVEKPVSHTIEEGVEMVRAIEASKQIVQTGTQQRSWDHWILGKQIVDSGRLGQITFVHTYWYQHARAGSYAPVTIEKLDWKAWLGPAPDQPFRPERFYQWRHYWDFGGGCLTDLMTHWIDVVHWYMNVEAPISAFSAGHNYNIKIWEAPDTVSTTLEFPELHVRVPRHLRQPRGRRRSRVPRGEGHAEDRSRASGLLPRRRGVRGWLEHARSRRSSSARAATDPSHICRTGLTAFEAARRRTRASASGIRRRARRTSRTPRCAPATLCGGTTRPAGSRGRLRAVAALAAILTVAGSPLAAQSPTPRRRGRFRP